MVASVARPGGGQTQSAGVAEEGKTPQRKDEEKGGPDNGPSLIKCCARRARVARLRSDYSGQPRSF